MIPAGQLSQLPGNLHNNFLLIQKNLYIYRPNLVLLRQDGLSFQNGTTFNT